MSCGSSHLVDSPSVSISGRVLGVFIVLAAGAVFLLPMLGLPEGHVISSQSCDAAAHFYAWRHYGFGMMREGELALWNPYVLCGVPFLANIQSAILYPLNGVFLWGTTAEALNLSFVIHFLVAGLAAYLLAAVLGAGWLGAVIAGCSYMLSANLVHRLYAGHLPAMSTMVWFPLGLCCVEKFVLSGRARWCVLGGIVGAFQITAGHIQYAVYSQVLSWLYLVARMPSLSFRRVFGSCPVSTLASLALLIVLPCALAAAQLLPAFEYAALSVRRDAGPGFSEGHAFPPWQLFTLIAPGLFGGGRSPYWGYGYFWEGVLYVGASVLALCVASLWHRERGRVAALAAVAIVSLVLALGPHTPCLGFAATVLPVLEIFRGPAKLVFATSLTLCVLAGLGTSALMGAVAHAAPERSRA